MEEVAGRIIDHLYGTLVDHRGESACILARLFKSHPYGELDARLQSRARRAAPHAAIRPQMPCLTLLASRGELEAWNGRQGSVGHQAIPLPSEQAIEAIPMISRLIRQFGLPAAKLVGSNPSLLLDDTETSFNVFYVPDALGSPCIPAQETFVKPHGIRSVIGFGGMLPGDAMFAIILFLRASVSRDVAEMFRPLSLTARLALMRFVDVVYAQG